MKSIFYFLNLLFIVALFNGCAASGTMSDSMGRGYEKRPALSQGLLNSKDGLSEQQIQKLLTSRVIFPQNINVAILKIQNSYSGLDFLYIDENLEKSFFQNLKSSKRVRAVTVVPEILLAKPIDALSLRQTAALLQADVLIVIRAMAASESEFRWFEADKVKAKVSSEVFVMDIRTGAVPYAGLISTEINGEKTADDKSVYGAEKRIKAEGDSKLMKSIADEFVKFLAKAS